MKKIMRTSFWLQILVAIFLFAVIIEYLYLFVFLPRSFTSSPSTPSSSSSSINLRTISSDIYHKETFDNLPPGYINASIGGGTFLFVAKIDNIRIEKNGDVHGRITYNLDNGNGSQMSTDVLFYAHTAPNHYFTLERQSIPQFFARSGDISDTTIDMKNNPQQFLDTMKHYNLSNAILTFLVLKNFNGQLEKTYTTNPQAKFVGGIKTCNTAFLDHLLNTTTNKPPCTPYILQVNVRDTSL